MPEKSEKYFFLLTLALLCAFIIMYGYYLIHNACLVYGDESLLFTEFLKRKKIPTLCCGARRFSPLVLQEYRLFVSSNLNCDVKVILMKIVLFIKMFLSVVFIVLGMRKVSINKAMIALTCFLALTAVPGLRNYWSMLVVAETTVTTLWASWFVCFVSARYSNKGYYYILAVIFATIAFYVKETAFILFLPSTLLILAINFKELSQKAKLYHLMILLQTIVFFLAYYCSIRHQQEPAYGNWLTTNRFEIISSYLRSFPIAAICGLLLIIKFIRFLIGKKTNISMADILSLNSFSFVCAYVILRMSSAYYFLPANVALCVALLIYLHEFGKSKLVKKLLALVNIKAIFACILLGMLQLMRTSVSEMLLIQKNYLNTKILLKELSELKKAGHVLATYMPRPECSDEKSFGFYYWGAAQTIARLVAFHLNDFSYEATFIGKKKFEPVLWCQWADHMPYLVVHNTVEYFAKNQTNNKFLIFDDPLMLTNAFQADNVIYLYMELGSSVPNLKLDNEPFKELPFDIKLYRYEPRKSTKNER
jgi:hypothetical protein